MGQPEPSYCSVSGPRPVSAWCVLGPVGRLWSGPAGGTRPTHLGWLPLGAAGPPHTSPRGAWRVCQTPQNEESTLGPVGRLWSGPAGGKRPTHLGWLALGAAGPPHISPRGVWRVCQTPQNEESARWNYEWCCYTPALVQAKMPLGLLLSIQGAQQGQQGLIEPFNSSVSLRVVRSPPALDTAIQGTQLLHEL